MIQFPGDDQLENPTGQSYGVFGAGGAELYGAINGNSISVTNLNASAITAGTIDASIISVTNINANNITSGTINASTISVTNLSASNITSGTLSADRIGANSIEASKLSVSSLSAISANLGTVRVGGSYGGGLNVYGQAAYFYDSSNKLGGVVYGTNQNIGLGASHGVYLVPGSGYKVVLSENINMNEKSIDACDTIWAHHFNSRCEVAKNINPFDVMKTFEADKTDKSKTNWQKLDHSKLHPSISDSTTNTKINFNNRAEPTKEKQEVIEGFSLNKLVELQRQAILELKDEVDQLKNAR